jgi:tripartite-type tricarboxylate transporter receptor subunit TctC
MFSEEEEKGNMKKTRNLMWLALLPAVAFAQGAVNYPTKAVRIIVPFAAGGPTDTHSRWAAQQLNAALGQPMVVDNRGGAGGIIGTEMAAKSPPDGYTLLGGNPGPLTIAPSIRKQLPYDALKDFVPITLIAKSQSCICVHPSLPVKNVKEFVALAKSKPGRINYATPGVGTVGHFGVEYLAYMTGIKMNMVPYKGAAPYVIDLIAGQIDMAFVQVAQAAPHVHAGRMKALGTTGTQRSPLLANVPTADEQGVKGYSSYNWNGILAPAGTPKAIVDRIHAVLSKPLHTPETRDALQAQGFDVAGDGPDEFAAFMKAETERWAKVGKAAGIKPE